MISKLFTAALLMLAVQPSPSALAQSHTRAADCEGELPQQQMNYCTAQAYWESDAELNRVYREFKPTLPQSEQERLTDSSLAWIEFRDAECGFRSAVYKGGSLQPLIHAQCMLELTQDRIAELPPSSGVYKQSYEYADSKLNENYRRLMGSLPDQRQNQLIDAQLAWIDYRDRQCEFAAHYHREHNRPRAQKPARFHYGCLIRLTNQRSFQL